MNIKEFAKNLALEQIRGYLSQNNNYDFKILDIWFPEEAEIRSKIGGLETSLGTKLWEKLAKTLAAENGFEILNEKEFNKSVPKINSEIRNLIAEITSRAQDTDISMVEFLDEIKIFIATNNIISNTNEPIKRGTGVDIWLKKDNIEFMFDIKTVKPNVGDFNKFFQQLIYWNAHRALQENNINLKTAIVFPYNPFANRYWENYSCNPLVQSVDALAGDEFWEIITGRTDTLEKIFEGFYSLVDNQEFIELKNTYF